MKLDMHDLPEPAPLRPLALEARRTLVVEAAIRWWEAQRPAEWTEALHLQMPEAGTTGREAFLLADAVGSLMSHVRDLHDRPLRRPDAA